MALIIVAPQEKKSEGNNKKLFMAGGISNCHNWQEELIFLLKDVQGLTIYNPRRDNFDVTDIKMSEEQITWEYMKLKEADVISFWFSRESLNPITLYELGMWGNSRKVPVVIGIDEGYGRKMDVEFQTKLARPDVNIVYTVPDLAEAIMEVLQI